MQDDGEPLENPAEGSRHDGKEENGLMYSNLSSFLNSFQYWAGATNLGGKENKVVPCDRREYRAFPTMARNTKK